MTKIKTKFLLGLIGEVITNGNKHLSTFENPIIHYPIFNVKYLNFIKNLSFKAFNNVLGKEDNK
jgi:hypothetical protein